MKHYQHVCNQERLYIWQVLREGKTQKQIAEALGRHPSTLSREIKRHTYTQNRGQYACFRIYPFTC